MSSNQPDGQTHPKDLSQGGHTSNTSNTGNSSNSSNTPEQQLIPTTTTPAPNDNSNPSVPHGTRDDPNNDLLAVSCLNALRGARLDPNLFPPRAQQQTIGQQPQPLLYSNASPVPQVAPTDALLQISPPGNPPGYIQQSPEIQANPKQRIGADPAQSLDYVNNTNETIHNLSTPVRAGKPGRPSKKQNRLSLDADSNTGGKASRAGIGAGTGASASASKSSAMKQAKHAKQTAVANKKQDQPQELSPSKVALAGPSAVSDAPPKPEPMMLTSSRIHETPATSGAQSEPFVGPQVLSMKPRRTKMYSVTTASGFCHICSRKPPVVQLCPCSRLREKKCRKVVCNRCFVEYKWNWKEATKENSDWVCPHCRDECPGRAQCNNYARSNMRRSNKESVPRNLVRNMSGGGSMSSPMLYGMAPMASPMVTSPLNMPQAAMTTGSPYFALGSIQGSMPVRGQAPSLGAASMPPTSTQPPSGPGPGTNMRFPDGSTYPANLSAPGLRPNKSADDDLPVADSKLKSRNSGGASPRNDWRSSADPSSSPTAVTRQPGNSPDATILGMRKSPSPSSDSGGQIELGKSIAAGYWQDLSSMKKMHIYSDPKMEIITSNGGGPVVAHASHAIKQPLLLNHHPQYPHLSLGNVYGRSFDAPSGSAAGPRVPQQYMANNQLQNPGTAVAPISFPASSGASPHNLSIPLHPNAEDTNQLPILYSYPPSAAGSTGATGIWPSNTIQPQALYIYPPGAVIPPGAIPIAALPANMLPAGALEYGYPVPAPAYAFHPALQSLQVSQQVPLNTAAPGRPHVPAIQDVNPKDGNGDMEMENGTGPFRDAASSIEETNSNMGASPSQNSSLQNSSVPCSKRHDGDDEGGGAQEGEEAASVRGGWAGSTASGSHCNPYGNDDEMAVSSESDRRNSMNASRDDGAGCDADADTGAGALSVSGSGNATPGSSSATPHPAAEPPLEMRQRVGSGEHAGSSTTVAVVAGPALLSSVTDPHDQTNNTQNAKDAENHSGMKERNANGDEDKSPANNNNSESVSAS